jgi:hypothetical protein
MLDSLTLPCAQADQWTYHSYDEDGPSRSAEVFSVKLGSWSQHARVAFQRGHPHARCRTEGRKNGHHTIVQLDRFIAYWPVDGNRSLSVWL